VKLQKKISAGAAIAGCILISTAVYGQNVKVDTMQVKNKTAEAQVKADSMDNGEIVLEDIYIEGRISKPGVMIVPKRLEPKLKEKNLKRSFKEELNRRSNGVYKPGSDLHKVDRVKSIKKALTKKRKK